MMIKKVHLNQNDLDFWYSPTIAHTEVPTQVEYQMAVDCSEFFVNDGDHLVFSLDCEPSDDPANPHKPHTGPIYRHGRDMYSTGRGAIVFDDGSVRTEEWNGTFSPVLYDITNVSGNIFDPLVDKIWTFKMTYNYGSTGMSVTIRRGIGDMGLVLFQGTYATPAKPWTGRTRALIGGIGPNFVSPASTGDIEDLSPKLSPNAAFFVTGWTVRTIGTGQIGYAAG